MNFRACILGSVAANLALVAALLWQAARMPALSLRGGLSITTNVVTEYLSDPTAAPPVVKIPGSPPFHWSQLEATNHFTYLTNLLAIGCPKDTARDILTARVADDFRARLREHTLPLQARFWDVASADARFDDLFKGAPLEQTLEELKAEKQRVQAELQKILGNGSKADPARNEQFTHLPAAKQAELTALDERQTKERDDLKREIASTPAAERGEKQRELRDRQQKERRALLTDTEWDEAELRRSPQAAKVRELRGYTATPEELRSLARSLREFDNAHPQPVARDPKRPEEDADYKAKRDEREMQRQAFLTARLGKEGFATYERAGDPRFHVLLKLARRLEVPPAAAVQWLELQTAAQELASRSRQDAALSADALALALLATRAESERTLQTVVGTRGWAAYQRYAGEWLKQLEK